MGFFGLGRWRGRWSFRRSFAPGFWYRGRIYRDSGLLSARARHFPEALPALTSTREHPARHAAVDGRKDSKKCRIPSISEVVPIKLRNRRC